MQNDLHEIKLTSVFVPSISRWPIPRPLVEQNSVRRSEKQNTSLVRFIYADKFALLYKPVWLSGKASRMYLNFTLFAIMLLT